MEWFITELEKSEKINKAVKELENMEFHIVLENISKSKNGTTIYKRWRKVRLDKIDECMEEDNLFTRLKRSKRKEQYTVFDNIKRLRGRK